MHFSTSGHIDAPKCIQIYAAERKIYIEFAQRSGHEKKNGHVLIELSGKKGKKNIKTPRNDQMNKYKILAKKIH